MQVTKRKELNGANSSHPQRSTLDDRGLAVPAEIRRLENEARLTVWRSVSVARHNHTQSYVVRGVESGGAIAQLGHYVTFAAEDGSALNWLHPLDALGANQTHAVVVAPSLVRIEVLRVQRNYELAITSHRVAIHEDKPRLISTMLFRASGFLGLELWDKDKILRGGVLPTFYTRAGEELPVPTAFETAVKAAVHGACCVGCRESHYLRTGSTAVDERIPISAVTSAVNTEE